MKKSYLLILLLFPVICLSQTTVYHETFGTSATNPYTGDPSTATEPIGLAAYNVSTATGIISTVLNATDAQLQISGLTVSPVNGREYMTAPISSLTGLNPILNLNSGPITWTFNMKTTRTTVLSSASDANYGLGQYYSDVVLASTGSNLVSGTNGYAVILQRSNADATKNSVRLSRFTNGLSAGSTATVPGTSVYSKLAESPAFTSLTNSISVKVVYTPSTEKWELFYREDPSATFVDPTTGTLTSAGAAVTDNIYTGTTMTHIGYLGSHANSASTVNSFQYDNFKITVTPVVTTNYYYDGSGSLNDVTNWGTNTDGTGTNPPNFTTDDQFFNIRTTLTTDAAWVVSGNGTKIIVGDATLAPVTVTIALGFPITGTIEVKAASSGSNIILVKDNIFPTFGSSNLNSEVHFQTKGTVTGGTFGKVFVDGDVITDTVSFAGAPNTILTSLLVSLNSFMQGSATTANFINASGAAVTINGYFRTTRSAGLTTANTTPAGVTANGVIQFSGADNIILGPASTIEYARGTSATVQTINPRSDYFNLTIVGDANNKTIAAATTVAGTLTLNITGTSTLTGMSNVTFANNASIFRTNGAFDAAPTFGALVNLTYNGTTAVTSGNELPTSTTVLNNLTINNAGGVTLNAPATVNGVFTLTNGVLTTSTANKLVLSAVATTAGGSNTTYVSGPMVMNTSAAATYTFPVGKAGVYRPFSVNTATANANAYTGEYFNTDPHAISSTYITPVTGIADNEYYDIAHSTGSDAATITFTLNGAVTGGTASDRIIIAHYNSGTPGWENTAGGYLQGDATSGSITSGSLTSFSPFTFGLKPAVPLPLHFISFEALNNNGFVKLKWKTADEINVNRYVVEESINGNLFIEIKNINANNRSGTNLYSFTRPTEINNNTYFRIKIVNANGKIEYSNIILVKLATKEVTIYPNPVSNTLNISGVKNTTSYRIMNAMGQVVLMQNTTSSSFSIDVANLQSGLYFIEIVSTDKTSVKQTFIKK